MAIALDGNGNNDNFVAKVVKAHKIEITVRQCVQRRSQSVEVNRKIEIEN